jgi:signal transduction histidine kinase/CheY-like chemotaxis protein
VAKPIDRIELRARLRTVTRLNRYRKLRHEHARLKQEIEEREKLQAQFAQAQKMEAVGRLAGGVAHDFNNLLTVILGHTELALMDKSLSEPLHNCLNEIQMAAELSADLTRHLLAFSSKQTIAPRVLGFNSTVQSMLKLVQRLIGEDIQLEWKPARGDAQVRMDPSQLDQVLANLCVNARDAIGGAGKITITSKNTVLSAQFCENNPGITPGDYVLLSVSDDGCGMDGETMGKIFEPFFTTKKKGEGTGLGLSTVYGVVKQNDGHIEVESDPGGGTTIRVYLPEYKSHPEALNEQLSEVPTARGSETVLLVEDEPGVLKIAGRMLKNLGYAVLTATTADEAIDLVRSHPGRIDLLLTDVIMPKMNGGQLVKEVMTLRHGIKYLYMSGYSADIVSGQGVLADETQFITKPFSINELAEKLREVLEDG